MPLRQFRNRRILAQRLKRIFALIAASKSCVTSSFSLHRLRQSRTFHTLANGPKSGVQLENAIFYLLPDRLPWRYLPSRLLSAALDGPQHFLEFEREGGVERIRRSCSWPCANNWAARPAQPPP